MPISMYQASVPSLVRSFESLSVILKKAAEHPEGSALLEARLAPDMLTLAGQVQRASDTAKGAIARLAGIENPPMPDTEKTFDDLHTRIQKTVGFLQSVSPAQIDGSESKRISLKVGTTELKFTGESYLLSFVLPNFYFHITTAYDILRHKGVALSKRHYLGRIQ